MARFQVTLFFESDKEPSLDVIEQAVDNAGVLIDHIEIKEIKRVPPVYNSVERKFPPPEYTGEW